MQDIRPLVPNDSVPPPPQYKTADLSAVAFTSLVLGGIQCCLLQRRHQRYRRLSASRELVRHSSEGWTLIPGTDHHNTTQDNKYGA